MIINSSTCTYAYTNNLKHTEYVFRKYYRAVCFAVWDYCLSYRGTGRQVDLAHFGTHKAGLPKSWKKESFEDKLFFAETH